MRSFGSLLLFAGVLIGAYALLIFDASISTSHGRVNNLGLMADRQNLLIAACAVAVIGAVLLGLGGRSHADDGSSQADYAFMASIQQVDIPSMKELLKNGAVDPNGRAPGSKACWVRVALDRGGVDQCKVLLAYGADPELPDGFGSSPKEYLRKIVGNQANDHHETGTHPRAQRLLRQAQADRPLQSSLGASSKDFMQMFDQHKASDRKLPIAARPTSAGFDSGIVQQLNELARLRDAGHLTPEEFTLAKTKALAR